jgi:hypothetical protein
VEGAYGSGHFLKRLEERQDEEEKVLKARIKHRDSIYEALKVFLGTGR